MNSARAGICSRVKGWKIDSWNRLGNKFGIEVPMSMSTSKSIFHTESILGIDAQVSINVYKYGLSLCSLAGRYDNPIPPRFLAPIDSLKIPALPATQREWQRGKEGRHLSPSYSSRRGREVAIFAGIANLGDGLWSQIPPQQRGAPIWSFSLVSKMIIKYNYQDKLGPPTTFPASECVPPPEQKGGGGTWKHLPAGDGVPIRTTGEKA